MERRVLAAGSGFSALVYQTIDTPLFAGLVVAAIVGLVGWSNRSIIQRRRFGWSVLYDEAINQGDPVAPSAPGEDGSASAQNMWEIVYQEGGPHTPSYPVRNGSLVVLEMRNIGYQPIRESDFEEERQDFTVRFPGRRVVHYKVRDNDRYHERVHDDRRIPPRPGAGDSFNLPSLQMNHNDGFKLLVLLEAPAARTESFPKPRLEGSIAGGNFVEFGNHPRRRRYIVAAAIVLVLLAGTFVGVRIATGAQALSPDCVPGNLTVAGSTAFAPTLNQVATQYDQRCTGSHITINADGSNAGISDLENNDAQIAMYDGTDSGLDPEYQATPVGDIIFAVVGNDTSSSDKAYFGKDGLETSQIRELFGNPGQYDHVVVGRSSDSGTREAFAKTFLQGNDESENGASLCPARGGRGLCLESTTMELLTYVNVTPGSLGYAEADALPFFPDVAEIPVHGYLPTRANVLGGHYSFLATEHLYTNSAPSGLAAAFIDFLTSAPMTTQLRTTSSLIACSDLEGTARSGDCG
jgi:ABC-type phosphate transport system substrate-binding protein